MSNSYDDVLPSGERDPIFSAEEIGRLKELAATPKRWWRNYPFVVSVLAFLLSLITSSVSIYASHRKDIHDQQAELAGALRSLQELTVQQLELQTKYAGRPEEMSASNLVKNQAYNTTLQATDLALKLGPNSTTAVLLPLSQRLLIYGQGPKALQIGELALTVAASIEDEVGALRWLATMDFQSGRPDGPTEGSKLFQKALELDSKYDVVESHNVAIRWLRAGTLFEWAHYLAPTNCAKARENYSGAVDILNSLPQSPDADVMRARVRQELPVGVGGVSSCKVAEGTTLKTLAPIVAAPIRAAPN